MLKPAFYTIEIRNLDRGYKTSSMLNSTEHEILNAHKCKIIEKFSFFFSLRSA